MIKNSVYLLISAGLFIAMINGCEKDSNKSATNIDLLTNGSSKIWC
jgi:hypothetical protein